MKKWADFLPAVMLHLPGCPEFTVEDALRTAAIEFCSRTRVWRGRQVTLATTVAGQPDYSILDNPEDAGLNHIQVAWVGDREIGTGTPGDDIDSFPGETNTDYSVELIGRATIRLNPAPKLDGEVVKATVSYAPTEVAYGIADALYFRWHEAIEKKAMHDLMIQVNKPWSNPNMAVFNRDRWERLRDEAANSAGPVRRQGLRVTPW